MNISFYTGAAGMIAQQEGMNIYSHNISNVNTVGFKSLRPSFADCLYTKQRETEDEWQTGHGQYIMKTDFMWEQGSFFMTDQALDFAIPGDIFFMVQDERGDTYLTRDGAFSITNVGDHWELVSGRGEFVLDNEGNHITVPFVVETRNIYGDAPVEEPGAGEGEGEGETTEPGNPIIDGDTGTVPGNAAGQVVTGTEEVQTSTIDYEALTDMIGLFEVDNNWGLDQNEDNHFAVTPRSGDARPSENRDLIREALEMSTVDLAAEMVHLIEVQRSYQLSSKVVTTSDELMNIANNLR